MYSQFFLGWSITFSSNSFRMQSIHFIYSGLVILTLEPVDNDKNWKNKVFCYVDFQFCILSNDRAMYCCVWHTHTIFVKLSCTWRVATLFQLYNRLIFRLGELKSSIETGFFVLHTSHYCWCSLHFMICAPQSMVSTYLIFSNCDLLKYLPKLNEHNK